MLRRDRVNSAIFLYAKINLAQDKTGTIKKQSKSYKEFY
jgi:hypothetical protein